MTVAVYVRMETLHGAPRATPRLRLLAICRMVILIWPTKQDMTEFVNKVVYRLCIFRRQKMPAQYSLFPAWLPTPRDTRSLVSGVTIIFKSHTGLTDCAANGLDVIPVASQLRCRVITLIDCQDLVNKSITGLHGQASLPDCNCPCPQQPRWRITPFHARCTEGVGVMVGIAGSDKRTANMKLGSMSPCQTNSPR